MKILLIPLLLMSFNSHAENLNTPYSFEMSGSQQNHINQDKSKSTKIFINIDLYKERDDAFGEKITSDIQRFSFNTFEGDIIPLQAIKLSTYPVLITNCFGKPKAPPTVQTGISGNMKVTINDNNPKLYLNLKNVVETKNMDLLDTQSHIINQEVDISFKSPTIVDLGSSKMSISITKI